MRTPGLQTVGETGHGVGDIRTYRIGCYGEFSFTQVSDGKVSQLKQGFFESATQERSDWPKSFRLVAWAYFPVAYQALDPKLLWYQCKVLSPGNDLHLLGGA